MVCRKFSFRMNKSLEELMEEVRQLTNRVVVLELEKEALAQKVVTMEIKTNEVKNGLEDVEKEVEKGMEKAKEEVKKEVKNKMKQIEANIANVVIYGIPEPNEEDNDKR